MNALRIPVLVFCLALAGSSACQPASAPSTAAGEAAPAADDPTTQPTTQATTQPSGEGAQDHGSHGGQGGGRPGPLGAGETGHYGAPFALEGEPMALSAALESCVGTGAPCKVAGTIERVCQSSGCWFTLAAPDVPRTVRVTMLNYGFFVPRNTVGASVVLEGTLSAREVPQAEAQHYADDEAAAGTAPARQVAGPEQSYEIVITGAQLTLN
jgi:hypothetical protein